MQQWIDLLKKEEGRKYLAQEFVAALEDDDSQPVAHRDGWKGEKALRKLESQAVATLHMYREWAEFCRDALEFGQVPTIQALFLVNRINGLRRLPEGKRDDELIRDLFAEAKTSIEDLDDTPRKTRLVSLLKHNESVYNRVFGNYLFAAANAAYSADLAEAAGDKNSAAISRFTEKLELVNAALVNYPEGVSAALTVLQQARMQMIFILGEASDPTSVRWMYLNAPIHMLFAYLLAGEPNEDAAADIGRLVHLREVDPEAYKEHAAGITFARAACDFMSGDFGSAHTTAQRVVDGPFENPPSPEYLAACYLILARVKLAWAAKEADPQKKLRVMLQAGGHLVAAKNIKGSAHQVRAVAQRLFDSTFE